MALYGRMINNSTYRLESIRCEVQTGLAYYDNSRNAPRITSWPITSWPTSGRPARYMPSITCEEVHAKDLDTLVDRVSGGRVTPLVAHLINRKSVSAEEIRELKALVKAAENRTRKSQKKGTK